MHFRRSAARLTAALLLVSALVTPALAVAGTVNTEGSSLRMRSEANTSAAVLKQLAHGTQVEVLTAVENGWYQVSCDGTTGYVSGDYLTIDSAAAATLPVESEPVYVRITADTLNVRTGPSTEHDKAGKLYAGYVTEVLEALDGWYKIEEGYISAEYAVEVDAAEAATSGKGQEIANYALQFVGYPYVYGGSSPKGFDCSGFTSYIYKQFGHSLNRTASAQLDNGYTVSRSELQPGDLVIFKKGSSSKRATHVGLYIGNNQFVHASTSRVGVIVSGMDEAYYTTGFVGGRRIV